MDSENSTDKNGKRYLYCKQKHNFLIFNRAKKKNQTQLSQAVPILRSCSSNVATNFSKYNKFRLAHAALTNQTPIVWKAEGKTSSCRKMVDLHSWNWLFTPASVFGSNYKLIELLGIINFLHHCISTTINTQNTTAVKLVIEQRTYSFVCMRKGMFRHYSAISKPRNHLCEIQEHQLILKNISIVRWQTILL